jgi:hypothetical protein
MFRFARANMSIAVAALFFCTMQGALLRAGQPSLPPMLGTLNGSDYLVSVDRNTGVGTRIGHLGISPLAAMTALEFDALHGILYGAVNSRLMTVNPMTGAATTINPSGLDFLPKGLAHDPNLDVLYGAGFDPATFARKNLYQVNRATGESTLLGPVTGTSFSLQGLAFDAANDVLFGLDEILPAGARIVEINPTTLVATPITANINPSRTGWSGLAFDPFTQALFVNDDRELYRVDPTTGGVVSVGLTLAPGPETYGALTVLVPEPTALGLAAVCFSVLPTILRRRRNVTR